MKILKHLLFFLCVIFEIESHAQQVKIEFTPQLDIKNDITNFHKYDNILYSSHTQLALRYVKVAPGLKGLSYGIILTKYGDENKGNKMLSIDDGKKDFAPLRHFVHYGEKYIYVIYFKKEEEGNLKGYVTKVNPEDLSVVTTKEIMEFNQKTLDFWKGMKDLEEIQSFYTVSEDGKRACIINVSPTQMLSTVIDGDLNILEKTDQSHLDLDKLFITAAYIDNDGNKVMAYRYDNPLLKNFYTRGLFFQTANNIGEFKPIKYPNGALPGNLALHLSKDGKKLYVGAEYYGQEYVKGGQGVLLGEVKFETRSVSNFTLYPYTEELKSRVYDLKFATKSKGNIVFRDKSLDYRIEDMPNGTVILSADMFTSETSSHGFPYNGPIIHIFVKPGGNTIMSLVPKIGSRSPVTGYFNYIFDDKLICIYADHPKNQGKDVKDKDIKYNISERETIPVANIYSSEGNLLSRIILVDNSKDTKGNIFISYGSKIEEHKFLFPVGKIKAGMGKYNIIVDHICTMNISNLP
jgi:hypothetical protein